MKTKPDIISDVRRFIKSRVILSAAGLDVFSKLVEAIKPNPT
jgi:hypothetical protein